MPTYDFICENCGHKFSEFVSLREKDSVRCPICNGRAKQRFTGFMYMGKGGTESGGCGGSCGSCSGCG